MMLGTFNAQHETFNSKCALEWVALTGLSQHGLQLRPNIANAAEHDGCGVGHTGATLRSCERPDLQLRPSMTDAVWATPALP